MIIDRTAVKRLTLIAAVVSMVAAILALAIWRSAALAGGIGVGFVLGMAPFMSWTWILTRGFQTWPRRALAVLLLAAKLAAYAVLIYITVAREVVRPLGVIVGVTIVIFMFTVGALAMQPRAEAKP